MNFLWTREENVPSIADGHSLVVIAECASSPGVVPSSRVSEAFITPAHAVMSCLVIAREESAMQPVLLLRMTSTTNQPQLLGRIHAGSRRREIQEMTGRCERKPAIQILAS